MRESDGSESNPLGIKDRIARIRGALSLAGYKYGREYEVIPVPNITHITYGRDVGYTIEEEVLPEDIESISATKIREQWSKI